MALSWGYTIRWRTGYNRGTSECGVNQRARLVDGIRPVPDVGVEGCGRRRVAHGELNALDVGAAAPPISAVVARTEPDTGLLKPHPHLVQRAIDRRRTTPDACVLIGDSATDIPAARAAGTAVIAYANKHGKPDSFVT